MKLKINNTFVVLVISIIITYILWVINNYTDNFADLINYANLFSDTLKYGVFPNTTFDSYLSFVSSEPLWRFLILLGTFYSPSLEVFILSINFVTVFVFVRIGLSKQLGFIFIVILMNPLILDLIGSQIRNAFALAVLLLALERKYVSAKILLIACAALIHTSTIFIVILYQLIAFRARKKILINQRSRVLVDIIIGMLIAAFIAKLLPILLSYVGDRRAEYAQIGSSMFYMTFWLFLGVIYSISANRNCPSEHRMWHQFTSINFSLAFGLTLFGLPGIRFLCFGLLGFCAGLSSIKLENRYILLMFFIPYQFILYYYYFR